MKGELPHEPSLAVDGKMDDSDDLENPKDLCDRADELMNQVTVKDDCTVSSWACAAHTPS